MKILGVIPARFASTRFPGKPLADVAGKPMIQRVYEQCKKASRLTDVVVATDHAQIADTVRAFGGNVCLTAEHHPSGTDRCQDALLQQRCAYDYVINIQGDEPFIAPQQIDLLAALLDGHTQVATLIKKISTPEVILNPNVVKVVVQQNGEALFFSRSPVPHVRGLPVAEWLAHHTFYQHIGMYAYRADVLDKITQLPVSSLEKAESLEQLRWLEHGYRIKTTITDLETVGIDTPEDLAEAMRQIKVIP